MAHVGEKAYKCTKPMCGASFTVAGSLKRHILTHTGKKSYKCNVCSVPLSNLGSLMLHMGIHTAFLL